MFICIQTVRCLKYETESATNPERMWAFVAPAMTSRERNDGQASSRTSPTTFCSCPVAVVTILRLTSTSNLHVKFAEYSVFGTFCPPAWADGRSCTVEEGVTCVHFSCFRALLLCSFRCLASVSVVCLLCGEGGASGAPNLLLLCSGDLIADQSFV